MAKRKRPELPYWLTTHEELCSGCDAPYAYAVEVRCAGCDRAYCMVCYVTVDGETFCTECEGAA
jgi:hypothetical protein